MFHRHDFFRGHRRVRRFQKGDLKYVILDLINEKPRYGYDIIRVLEDRSHGLYTPSPGTIYPTLQLLEDMGYVRSEQRDGKKTHTITAEGRKYLEKKEGITAGIKNQMKAWWNPGDMQEITRVMGELEFLGQLVSRQAPGVGSDKMTRIRDVIYETHNEIEKILKE